MAIFEGAVGSAASVIGSLGFDWLLGSVIPNYSPIFVDLAVPDTTPGGVVFHVGGFSMLMPNDSVEQAGLAFALAQEALITIELAVALQTIMDPKGGIKIKDALDPYHYNIVKNALEENNEPVPNPTNPGATTLDKLGGAISEAGIFSGIAAAAGIMKTLSVGFNFLKFVPQVANFPPGLPIGLGTFNALPNATPTLQTNIESGIPGFGMPSSSLPLKISASAVLIKTAALSYITSLLRNSIDTTAGALLLKNVLDDFTVAVSENAIKKAGGEPPVATVQEGQSGIF